MNWTLPTPVSRVTWKYVGFAWNTVRKRGVVSTLSDLMSTAWFDHQHGLQAAIPVEVTSSNTEGGGSVKDAIQYQGVSAHLALQQLKRLPPAALQAHFVDYGCGKGRGMAVGMIAGFRRVAGVELMPKLAEVAEVNLKRLRRRFPQTVVHICVGDAAAFVPGDAPLVAFLYNPFRGETLRRVVARLQEHTQRHAVWVVYVNPAELAVFQEFGFQVRNEQRRRGRLEAVILEANSTGAARLPAFGEIGWRTADSPAGGTISAPTETTPPARAEA